MEMVLAAVTGGLYAAGLYLMLRRSIVRLVIGLSLISHAANLLIFSAAGMTRTRPPIVPEGALRPEAPFADPVPQALILTSIVLGFAILGLCAEQREAMVVSLVRPALGDLLEARFDARPRKVVRPRESITLETPCGEGEARVKSVLLIAAVSSGVVVGSGACGGASPAVGSKLRKPAPMVDS